MPVRVQRMLAIALLLAHPPPLLLVASLVQRPGPTLCPLLAPLPVTAAVKARAWTLVLLLQAAAARPGAR